MTQFLGGSVWTPITEAAGRSRWRAHAAVAYFGTGASKLLPLPKGSQLVVDASEASVKQGRTSPKELLKMLDRDVEVFSVGNLHAKVFVIGRTAFIGSANVSRHSKVGLVEAVMKTTKPDSVRQVRAFVERLCVNELGPSELERLDGLYEPPKFNGQGARKKSRPGRMAAMLPRVMIAQLVRSHWDEHSESVAEQAEGTARQRLEHPRKHELNHYRWYGNCAHRPGDIVVQILKEGDGRRMVSPPGKVIYTKRYRSKGKPHSFVFVEVPRRRRVSLDRLAQQLGEGAKKRLLRGGVVRQDFAELLLRAFNG